MNSLNKTYGKLTDGEISVMVCRLENPKYEAQAHPHNPKGAQYVRSFGRISHKYSFFPVSRAEDGFQIAVRNRIAIVPASKTTWEASHESGAKARHKNPLRAAMIVYLMVNNAWEVADGATCNP
ncbi:phage protein NinX family protein [Pantoea ananatis]|uniref:phage protein NinX family protein n=1 Tax=Pantoea ananas TaxID=553 RepID=UPI001B307818|nr:phage protein NinX family protein [Pantoea ananatis]